MNKYGKEIGSLAIKILSFVVVIILIYTTAKGQLEGIAATVKGIKWPFFILATAVYSVSIGVTCFRWYYLIKMQAIKLSGKECFVLHMSGHFFNTTTPGAVSGDLIKIATVMKRDPEKRLAAVMTIFMDRLIGLLALILLVLLLIIPSYDFISSAGSDNLHWAVIVVVLASASGVVFVIGWIMRRKLCRIPLITKIILCLEQKIPRLFMTCRQIFDTIDSYKSQWKNCLWLLFISMVSHIFLGLSFYLVGLSLGISANPLLFILSIQISNALAAILPLPGGLGIRDTVGKVFLMALGCSEVQAASTPLLYTTIILFWGLIASFFFLYWRTLFKKN